MRDLEASLDHYTRVLGFELDFRGPGPFAGLHRDRAALYLAQGDQSPPGGWIWIGVADVEALFEEYRRAGAMIRLPPSSFPWALEMQVRDPDGNVLRLGSEPRPDLPPGGWLDRTGRFWAPKDGDTDG